MASTAGGALRVRSIGRTALRIAKVGTTRGFKVSRHVAAGIWGRLRDPDFVASCYSLSHVKEGAVFSESYIIFNLRSGEKIVQMLEKNVAGGMTDDEKAFFVKFVMPKMWQKVSCPLYYLNWGSDVDDYCFHDRFVEFREQKRPPSTIPEKENPEKLYAQLSACPPSWILQGYIAKLYFLARPEEQQLMVRHRIVHNVQHSNPTDAFLRQIISGSAGKVAKG